MVLHEALFLWTLVLGGFWVNGELVALILEMNEHIDVQ